MAAGPGRQGQAVRTQPSKRRDVPPRIWAIPRRRPTRPDRVPAGSAARRSSTRPGTPPPPPPEVRARFRAVRPGPTDRQLPVPRARQRRHQRGTQAGVQLAGDVMNAHPQGPAVRAGHRRNTHATSVPPQTHPKYPMANPTARIVGGHWPMYVRGVAGLLHDWDSLTLGLLPEVSGAGTVG